jgi:hypothetical protein
VSRWLTGRPIGIFVYVVDPLLALILVPLGGWLPRPAQSPSVARA